MNERRECVAVYINMLLKRNSKLKFQNVIYLYSFWVDPKFVLHQRDSLEMEDSIQRNFGH